MFHHGPGRGGEHAVRFLEAYRGRFLQCDGYGAYDAPPRWHDRSRFRVFRRLI